MTTLLALDSSTQCCSVALLVNGHVYERHCGLPRAHAQKILPFVDELLAESQLCLDQLDGLALSVGPGSFTGIRIGLSIAQGLAYAADLPLFPFSSLAVLAEQASSAHFSERSKQLPVPPKVIVALDARMGEIYWACYEYDVMENSISQQVCAPQKSAIEAFNSELEQVLLHCSVSVGLGDGWTVAGVDSQLLSSCYGDQMPKASGIINILLRTMAAERFDLADGVSAFDVEPIYLRNEVSWKKRQRIRTTV